MIKGPACLLLKSNVDKRIVVDAKALSHYVTVAPYEQSLDSSVLLSEPLLLRTSKELVVLDKCRQARIKRHDNLFLKVPLPNPLDTLATAIACEFFYRAKRAARQKHQLMADDTHPLMDYGRQVFFALEQKSYEGALRQFINPIIVEEFRRR